MKIVPANYRSSHAKLTFEESSNENFPAPQLTQSNSNVAPVCGEYFPALQLRQVLNLLAITLLEYFPEIQSLHVALLSADRCSIRKISCATFEIV